MTLPRLQPYSGIRRLPPLLVNQIAAGEVIERPASVVKELVENSIDAGANRIRVVLEQGGRERIEISDDGHGIPAADLPLALAPHATSKIRAQDDLDAIATLGFRGEALASIMSVSRMTIVSRPREQQEAACIRAEGDRVDPVEPAAGPVGTTISVRNLFFATPARRKFLRTPQTEFNHISELVQRLAMSHPAIGFTLVHDEKVRLDLRPGQSPRERVLDILGREMENELLEISADDGGTAACLTLWGLLGTPAIGRGHAKAQYVFLNGRFVRDKTIMHALKEAYRGLLDPSKYPTAVIYLEMDPGFVDVNVHPTKAEVRFRDQQHVHGFLLRVMRDRLRAADLTPAVNLRNGFPVASQGAIGEGGDGRGGANEDSVAGRRFADFFSRGGSSQMPVFSPGGYGSGRGSGDGTAVGRSGGSIGFDYQTIQRGLKADADASPRDSGFVDGSFRRPDGSPISAADGDVGPMRAELVNAIRALQVHGSYLVIEEDDGISIVDQHALHERVMFEHLRDRILTQGTLEAQRLLVPAVIDLNTADRVEIFDRLSDLLGRLGIEADLMGPRQVAVHAFPSFLFERNVDPIDFMHDLMDLAEHNGLTSASDDGEAALQEVLDMMACKAAIKAGDRLTPQEIEALLARRHDVERAGRCPHGRPTTIRLSLRDLERQFGRR